MDTRIPLEVMPESTVTAGSYGPSEDASPSHGASFEVPYLTVDAKGRVTQAFTKRITLPSSGNTDTKVTQTVSTDNTELPVLAKATNGTSTVTDTSKFSANIKLNPSTGTVTATTFKGSLDGTAARATADASGNNIADTYSTKTESEGKADVDHVHGNISNDGKVGTTSGLPLITTTGGAVTTGSFGSTAGTFTEGNDSRLSDARTPKSHTHGNIQNDGTLGSTASLAVVTDGNKKVTVSSTTATEIGYVHGVTSSIQTQLNGKAATSHQHAASDITSGTLSVDSIPSLPASKIGSGTLDAARIPNIDASKITSGTIDIARLPAGALERCVVVEGEAGRFALTSNDVQTGDTVKQVNNDGTATMYFVVDDTHLDSEAGYEVYTAGSATSVPWSGVTDKPSSYTPAAHASTATTYGISDASKYGHAMATSTTPKAPASTAALGSETAKFARGDHVHPLQTTVSGNAGTATKFASNQTVELTGDVTGSASSQAGWSVATTLSNSGVTANSYGPSADASPAHSGTFKVPYITVDAKGRVTAAADKTITLPASGNTDTKVTQTVTTTSGEYPILAKNTTATATITDSSRFAAVVTLNPSTGTITATKFKGATEGNASSATEFASNQTVELTGDVTGSASSKAGWTVATTLANSGVTAGTIGNTSQQSPSHGGTFNIPYVTVDSKGRVTAGGTTTVKLPTDQNTDTKVNVTLGTTTKAYLLGTSTTPTSTAQAVTSISDTGVYLDTTAGRLTAGSFAGNGQNITLGTASALVVTDTNKKLTTATTLPTSAVPNIDASKITSGTIDIARLPEGALERLVVVADQTARFALTTDDVQVGDTVKQTDTGVMYFVKDTDHLDSADGYEEYTAGAATSVPWSGVTGKPSSYTPAAHASSATTYGVSDSSNYGHAMASSTTPIVAGTANVGSETAKFARGDHIHPAQTTVSGNAGSATKLATARTIDGVDFNGTAAISHYGSCSTAAGTAEKAVSVSSYKLVTGSWVAVKFTVTNTASNPTLNVNSTGAKAIYYRGAAITAGYLAANRTYLFVYNGTQYELIGDINTDTNNATAQNISTSDATYPILIGATANATANIGNKATYFSKDVKLNPSTGVITANGFSGPISGNASSATEFASNQTVELTGDVSGSASSKAGWSVATTLANSGVTAGSYGPSANATPGYGATFNVPYITVDAKGRVTAASTKTVKIPASDDTDTKVTQTVSTDNVELPLLAKDSNGTTTVTSGSKFAAAVKLNPSTGTVTATKFVGPLTGNVTGNVSGNAGTATKQSSTIADGAYADVINVTDGTNRVGTVRVTNNDGSTSILLGVHNESNGAPAGLTITNTDGVLTANFPGTFTATSISGNSSSATKLATARKIDGVEFNGTADIAHYGSCSTAAGTAEKAVSLTGYKLVTGSWAAVKFTVTNTAANPTLNINSTGAKAIYYRGAAVSAGYLAANRTYLFVYNGTQYDLIGDLDTNTTYSAGTGLSLSSNQFSLADSGVTAGTIGNNSQQTPSHGGTFNIPYVTVDAKGRVTAGGTTTVKLPTDQNTDTKVTQTVSTDNSNLPILAKASDATSTVTDTSKFAAAVTVNPSTGTVTATKFDGAVSGNADTSTKSKGVFLVIPNETTQTATLTATVTGITEYFPGLMVAYRAPFNTAASSTLNINSLGAKPIYYGVNTTSKDYYPANRVVLLVYETTTTSTGCWKMVYSFDSNNNNYDRRLHNNNVKAAAAVAASTVIVGTSAGYKQAASGVTFDVTYPILYASAAISSGGTNAATYEAMPSVNLQTTKASWTGTQYATVYLVGTISGTTVTIDSSVFTTTIPTTADGKIYIPLGVLYSTYQVFFAPTKDIYHYTNGSFHLYDPTTVIAGTESLAWNTSTTIATINGTAIKAKIPANPNTDTKVTQTVTTDSVELPILAKASNGTSTVTDTSKFAAAVKINPSTGTVIATKFSGDGSGLTALNGSQITSGTVAAARIANLDASKITSGTISIDRLPAGALERLVVVADQTARFALTTSNVQLGDTVKQTDTGVMYYVKDTSKLSSADGYEEYTAGAATSVPWSGVTSKPSSYTPSSHAHGNITNAGAIGSTANLPIITDTNGVLKAGSFGTSANTFCQGNDSRLSNARTPTAHASTATTYGAADASNYGHAMASSTTPKANGTAAVGSETAKFARGDHVHPLQTTVSGNAGTATKFASNQSVTLTGDVTGTASSQAGWSVATTLANSGVTAGRYSSVNVDAKGRVTAGNVKHSYTTAASAAKNWYRIANANISPIDTTKPLHVQFRMRAYNSAAGVGYWQTWFVDAEISGQTSGVHVFGESGAPFSQIRVLYENTASAVTTSIRPALDIYLNYVLTSATTIEIEELNNSGFDFVADGALAASSVPSGYENRAVGPYASGISVCGNADYATTASLQRSDISSNITLADNNTYRARVLNCTGSITVTVPSINSAWSWFIIKNNNTASGNITIHPSTTSVLIDGSNSDIVLRPTEYIIISSRAANSYTIVGDGRRRTALVGRSGEVGSQTKHWFQVAELTTSGTYKDVFIKFHVFLGAGTTLSGGILSAHARIDNTKGVVSNKQLQWDYKTNGLDLNDFAFTNTDTSGTSTKLQIWYKNAASYASCKFVVIAEHEVGDQLDSQPRWILTRARKSEGDVENFNSGFTGVVYSTLLTLENPVSGKATTAGTADKVANKFTVKLKSGTTENTDLYTYDGSGAKTLDIKQGSNITLTAAAGSLTIAGVGDTKNTAGSTDSSSKLFLIGATSQAANPQTYSHDTAYVGTDGCLYSGGAKVLTAHQTLPTLSYSETGSGNAITSLSVSNHAITATKGTTFLTSHQSLSNYVTLNGAQTISGKKTLSGGLNIYKSNLEMTVNKGSSDTTDYSVAVLKAIGDNAGYGLNLCLGGSGNTIVSGGEAGTSQLNDLKDNSNEHLYLVADGSIYFKTNGNTWANAKTVTLDTSAQLSGLAKVTSTSFVGDLTGNVTGNCSGTAANVTGTVAIANGGTGLTASPSMLTNLGSTTAANVLQASPRPGVTGTLAIGNGGTGLTSSPSMLTNLGSTTAANVLQASPRPGVTGTLPVANGGTGQTSVANIQAGKDGSGNTITSTYATKTELTNSFKSNTRTVEYIAGTQTASTGSFTGVTEDAALYDGKVIFYYLPYAGSGNATLNLTLSGGGTTGAKAVYVTNTTRLTTHYSAGAVIPLVYKSSDDCWHGADYWYDSNTYDRTLHNNNIKAAAAITAGTVIVGTSAGYKQAASGVTFDVTYPILYASAAISSGATNAKAYDIIPNVNLQTTKASWTGTQYAVVYLVGTISGVTVTIDSAVFTTTVPTTADGKVYIPLGVLASTYQVFFFPTKDIYHYTNGSFHPYDPTTAATGGSNGTIKINGTDVAVKGLGTAAYTASTAYAAASHGTHVTYATSGTPANIGTASNGSAATVARSDHVHALPDSGVTAQTWGNTSQQTPSHGGTFNIPYFTVSAKGIVTAAGTTTVKLPADNNTDTKVNVTLGTTTKAYLLGTSTTPTSTATGVTAISDTGVYLDTTAGRLTATSFAGDGQNVTLGTASKMVVTDANKKLAAASATTGSASKPVYLNAGAITAVDSALKSCYAVVESEAVTNNIFKIASGAMGATYNGLNLVILIQNIMGNGAAQWRISLNAGSTAGVFSAGTSVLVDNIGLDPTNFIVAYKSNSGGTLDFEIYTKIAARYAGYRFTVIQEIWRSNQKLGNILTLYNQLTSTGTAAITSGYTALTTTKATVGMDISGNAASASAVAWSGITSKPTTISSYGITDAKIDSGVITLGSNTITPLTSGSTLDATKLSGTASIATTGNAGSATKLATARTIDGVDFNGTAAISHYGSCSTAAGTAEKAVACTGYKLVTGSWLAVKFTVTNTAANPTLNVNSTGAKAIYYRGAAITAGYLAANRTYLFVYNGTQYELIGDIDTNSNTDTLMTQNVSTTNATYPILAVATADATANLGAKTGIFGSGVKLNPSTSTLVASSFNAANIEFNKVATNANNGGYIDFHYNGSTSDYTSRIIESASGTISINSVTINGSTITGSLTGNCSGTSSNVTGTVAIDHGGTGATTRLNAVKNLTNENVSTSAQYFLTITSSWGKAGYTSVADAKTVLGLKSAAYTESSAYAAASHNQASSTINALTGYTKPSSTSALATSDTLNAALGKLETALDDKLLRGSYERIQGTSDAHKNLNDYTSAGFYNIKTANVDNCPDGIGSDATLLVYPWNTAGYVLQEVTETAASGDTRRWLRKLNGSTWSSWKQMAFTSSAITGNAATATQFSANTTVSLTGDATGTSAGSKKGWSVPVTLANSGVTAGTYPTVTVDAKGRVTAGPTKHSYTTAANAAKNWYRLANAGSPIDTTKPLYAEFLLKAYNTTGGVPYYEVWRVHVSVWGKNSGIMVYGASALPFSQARVLYENTDADVTSSITPAIDIYLNAVLTAATTIEIEELYNSGWTFVANGALAASTVPSGYENRAQAVQVINTANSNWTSHMYAGTSSGTAKAATTNGNTYLICLDNSTARDRVKLAGTGVVQVSSDASNNVTINGQQSVVFASTDPGTTPPTNLADGGIVIVG